MNIKFLRNPGKYKSVSAFAPITNPINCPWGQKAFNGYFGDDQQDKWKEHDATELIKKWTGGPLDILIDVVCVPLSPFRPLYSLYESMSSNLTYQFPRAPATTSTNKASSYPKTSRLLLVTPGLRV
jgi:hypothetical protein